MKLDAGAEVKVAQLHRGEAVGVHAQNVLWLEVPEYYAQSEDENHCQMPVFRLFDPSLKSKSEVPYLCAIPLE